MLVGKLPDDGSQAVNKRDMIKKAPRKPENPRKFLKGFSIDIFCIISDFFA